MNIFLRFIFVSSQRHFCLLAKTIGCAVTDEKSANLDSNMPAACARGDTRDEIVNIENGSQKGKGWRADQAVMAAIDADGGYSPATPAPRSSGAGCFISAAAYPYP